MISVRIARTNGAGRQKPACTMALERVAPEHRKHAGLLLCEGRAEFIIDGEPRCRPHAAQLALAHVLREMA